MYKFLQRNSHTINTYCQSLNTDNLVDLVSPILIVLTLQILTISIDGFGSNSEIDIIYWTCIQVRIVSTDSWGGDPKGSVASGRDEEIDIHSHTPPGFLKSWGYPVSWEPEEGYRLTWIYPLKASLPCHFLLPAVCLTFSGSESVYSWRSLKHFVQQWLDSSRSSTTNSSPYTDDWYMGEKYKNILESS